jgi:hypothetical protein
MTRFKEIGTKIGALVDEKNDAYGSSFSKTEDFLKILYPNGISLAQYGDMQLVLRMFDKMMRIANKKDAFGESPYGDLAGYSILGIAKDQKDQEKAFTEKAQRATGSNKKV